MAQKIQLHLLENSDLVINTTFEKYLGGDWELIDNNVFTNQDLICI